MIFDDKTRVIHPMRRYVNSSQEFSLNFLFVSWGDINRAQFEQSIKNLRVGGGTYIAPGTCPSHTQ